MSKKHWISTSILSADFTCLKDQIAQAEAAGADYIHVDVMDGHFVPNLTMGPFMVEWVRKMTSLPIDVHLMIESPERLLANFAEAGANVLYVHIETCPNIHRTLENIKELGCRAGLVINPGTPVSAIEAVMPDADTVLVMTVDPGYSGQEFIPEITPKIAQVRSRLDQVNPKAVVAVDGGITTETLPQCIQAGAQFIITASAVYHYPEGIAAGIHALEACFPD